MIDPITAALYVSMFRYVFDQDFECDKTPDVDVQLKTPVISLPDTQFKVKPNFCKLNIIEPLMY